MSLPIHNIIASQVILLQIKSYSFREILTSFIMNRCQEQTKNTEVASIYTVAVTIEFCHIIGPFSISLQGCEFAMTCLPSLPSNPPTATHSG